jgi:hypothetical protein
LLALVATDLIVRYCASSIGCLETDGFASDIHMEIFGFFITADFDFKKCGGNLLAC